MLVYHFAECFFKTSVSGPCGTNVSLSLFQAELLNGPEFAKNVKGLEDMLRVRERLGVSSRVCVHVRNSALQCGSRDAGSVAPGAASVGIEGDCGRRFVFNLLMVVLAISPSMPLRPQVAVVAHSVLLRTLWRSRAIFTPSTRMVLTMAWARLQRRQVTGENLDCLR